MGRDMLQGAGDGLRSFYRNFCLGSEGSPGQPMQETMALSTLECTFPEQEALPSLLVCVAPCAGRGYVGYEPASRVAQLLQLSGRVTTLAVPGEGPLASVLHAQGRTYMLAHDGSTLWIAKDPTLAPERVSLPRAVGRNASLVRADSGGADILSADGKALFAFGPGWSLSEQRPLHCHYRLERGVAFLDGHVFLERQNGGHGGAGLLYYPPRGAPMHIAGGFRSPTHVSTHGQGLLVCDLSGLHLLVMDGLSVVRSACMPWQPLAEHLGHPHGVGYEALLENDSLHLVLKFNVPLVPRSRSYCVVHARLAQTDLLSGP